MDEETTAMMDITGEHVQVKDFQNEKTPWVAEFSHVPDLGWEDWDEGDVGLRRAWNLERA